MSVRIAMRALIVTVAFAVAGLAGGVSATQPPKKPAVAPASAGAPVWVVDKGASKLLFRSSFAGTGFEGGFTRWDAQIRFDPKNLAASKVVATVDLASVVSGDKDRDEALPSADWFDVRKAPKATFTTSSFKSLGGDRYQANGTLTLKGVTRPLGFAFTLNIKDGVARMNGQATIRRNEFGVGQGQFSGADTVPHEVAVPISLVARQSR